MPGEIAYIPEEAPPLEGLGGVNRDLVQRFGERSPEQRMARVDQDAKIIESPKQQALRTYEGPRGYQPMLAVWAETGRVLADQFRDGNVTARPKRLRFLIFNTPGRLAHHARRLILRLAAAAECIAVYRQGLRLLPEPTCTLTQRLSTDLQAP